MKTFLSETAAYPWVTKGGIFFRGYFISGNIRYEGEAAISYLTHMLEDHSTEDAFHSLNGIFSIIWDRESDILFAVDRLRGLPLFYGVVNQELWIGDDASSIAAALPMRSLNTLSMEEYFSTNLFVAGHDTLFCEISQAQSASFCIFDKKNASISEHPYFQMEHRDFSDDVPALIEKFHCAYQETARHLVIALNGRTAVVPLSGGADSRMVLSMLKQEGYQKVLCFTYGHPGNAEAKMSRQVAEDFGYPWIMVPYTNQGMKKIRNDAAVKEYQRRAFSFTSTPHMQDFPAVKYLFEHGKLPADSVFVPGHSGDLIAGSHITADFLKASLSREDFLQAVKEKFYLSPPSAALSQKIEKRFPVLSEQEVEALSAQIEWFNIQERQAKFIVNSVRVYEFFGFEWLIPLWDNTLFEFWKHIPISLRYNRKLYFCAVNNTLPSTNDVTPTKVLASRVRRIPLLRTLARRGTRFLRYWKSPLGLERLAPISVYLRACLCESPVFTINTLLCHQEAEHLKKDFKIHEKM